jgi:endo-alpha-1,4-polygalactosaminidase (GH114 family)
MGLDNGICARETGAIDIDHKLEKLSTYQWEGSYDIAYWRKCWNVRDAIGNALGSFYDNGITDIGRDEVLAIIKELKKFNRKSWHNRVGSIWTWREIKREHRKCIRNLQRLARLMKKYPALTAYFYDSY